MDLQIANDWFHLILRWFHVMAGISWIGSSLYFLYLGRVSARRSEPEVVRAGGSLDAAARWFKRETVLAWVSGVLLLFFIYFGVDRGGLLGAVSSVALFAAGWIAYDRLWLARPAVAGAVSPVLLVLVVWGLSRFYDGAFLYIEVGSLLGTLMAGNVWFRIVPALRPESEEKLRALAGQRSAHNNYLIFPVVALMVVNHVPGIYSSGYSAAILVLLIAAYSIARHVVAGEKARAWALGAMLALLLAMMVMTGG